MTIAHCILRSTYMTTSSINIKYLTVLTVTPENIMQ